MNILGLVFNKISLFDDEKEVLMLLSSRGVVKADDFTKGALVKMFRLVDANTTAYEKQTVLKCLEELAYFDNDPLIFRVNHGEDFAIEVDVEDGETFDGYDLRVYNAQDGTALGPAATGNADPKQEVMVSDIDLTPDHTYRAHVILESSGDANVLLTEVYLIVGDSIDYSETP